MVSDTDDITSDDTILGGGGDDVLENATADELSDELSDDTIKDGNSEAKKPHEASAKERVIDRIAHELLASSNEEMPALGTIDVEVTAILGQAHLKISNLLMIGRGAVIELQREVGAPIDIAVGGRKIGKADVIVQDESLAVELIKFYKEY